MITLQGKSPKLLVIGDLMIDHYLWCSCERISPEAPVQVINVNNESILLGGAGNVINNLKALGANVDVISIVGECDISDQLKGLLDDIEVDTKYMFIQQDRITSKKVELLPHSNKLHAMIAKALLKLIINHKIIFLILLQKLLQTMTLCYCQTMAKAYLPIN